MADEFAKGLGILAGGGMVWIAISAWLTSAGFAGTQLIAPPPEDPGTYAQLVLVLRDVLAWFMIFGVLAFWIVIPAFRELQAYREESA